MRTRSLIPTRKAASKEVVLDIVWQVWKASSLCETVRFVKQESGKKGGAQPKPEFKSKSKKSKSDADTGGGITIAALGEHFAKMETSALDPTQANMAQISRAILANDSILKLNQYKSACDKIDHTPGQHLDGFGCDGPDHSLYGGTTTPMLPPILALWNARQVWEQARL